MTLQQLRYAIEIAKWGSVNIAIADHVVQHDMRDLVLH